MHHVSMSTSRALREPSYLMLVALLDGPLHGYGITKAVEELSDGRVRLGAGTLYTALERMAGDGWITADGERTVEGRRRRYWRLTDEGQAVVAAEADRLAAAAALVHRRGGLRPAPVRP